MKLHQPSKTPDWRLVTAANRTVWQQIAAQTRGIVTPANIITCLGGVLVLIGLLELTQNRSYVGLAYVILGRLCDIADGFVAEHTGTKSRIGEAMDATIDKLTLLAALLLLTSSHILPVFFTAVIGLQAIAMTGVAAVAHVKHMQLHAFREGKNATAACWVALALFVLSALMTHDHHAAIMVFPFLGYITTVISLGFGVRAFQKSWQVVGASRQREAS